MYALPYVTLGERIHNARVDAALSQEKLAELVGVRRQAVNLWERDKMVPSSTKLVSIARATDRQLEDFSEGPADLETPANPAALKGRINKHLSAVSNILNESMEAIIEAEVERRVAAKLAERGALEAQIDVLVAELEAMQQRADQEQQRRAG